MENSLGSSTLVDALPYVDSGYDLPGVREAVVALIEDEMTRFPPKEYLKNLPPLNLSTFHTEVMQVEFKRMDEKKPMDRIDFDKYSTAPAANKRRDPLAWEECFNKISSMQNHLSNKFANLQLQSEYGPETWRKFIPTVERRLQLADQELKDIRNLIQQVNWDRKNTQLKAGEKLTELENTWVNLIAKNIQIERTCFELEAVIGEWEKHNTEMENSLRSGINVESSSGNTQIQISHNETENGPIANSFEMEVPAD